MLASILDGAAVIGAAVGLRVVGLEVVGLEMVGIALLGLVVVCAGTVGDTERGVVWVTQLGRRMNSSSRDEPLLKMPPDAQECRIFGGVQESNH